MIKFLEESPGRNLHDMEFGDDFLRHDFKSTDNKEKLDKMDFMKMKNFSVRRYYRQSSQCCSVAEG